LEVIGKRQKYELLRSQLDLERSSFINFWRDLGDYISVNRPRFQVTDSNRGQRKNQKIIDSTATLASRTLRSGMMSGVTSPARPWFRLTTPDPLMSEQQSVKEWLHTVTLRMQTAFARSNLYQTLPIVYGDIGDFGTAALLIDEDDEELFTFTAIPIGSYYLATNKKGRVDTFMRDLQMTVRQLIEMFGKRDPNTGMITNWENFSNHVKSQYDAKHYEARVDVCHVITPNDDYDPKVKLDAKFKRFSSCYYERGTSGQKTGQYMGGDQDKFLRESGYDYFPVLCPRWEVTGEDVYGTNCPGMLAIGDIKALQTMQKRKAQAIEKIVNPPLVAPSRLRNQKVTQLPGDVNYDDEREGTKGMRALHEVNFRINEITMDIQEHQRRISRAFFEDLILMINNDQRAQRATAREIDVREQERLVAFGPVLEQLNQDLLNPLIDIAFLRMLTRPGEIPEPPKEIQGLNLRVDYISIMAQAQKMVGLGNVERFWGFISGVASVDPSVLDKVNRDQIVDVYGDMTSVPPSLIISDEDVAESREARAAAQQQQAQAEQAAMNARAAKDLSQTKTSEDSLLAEMLGTA
jgi:hypothetical protein